MFTLIRTLGITEYFVGRRGEMLMFTLIRTLGIEAALMREFVPLAVAFVIAEMFYKFKSFALECLAFLVTWYVLSVVWSWIYKGPKPQ